MQWPRHDTDEAVNQRKDISMKKRGGLFQLKYDWRASSDPFADERPYGGHTRSGVRWPDPLPQSCAERPFFHDTQTQFRFGGCPEHPKRALVPRIAKDPPWKGTVRLFCSGVHQKTPGGFRKCLVSFPFSEKHLKILPLKVQGEYRSIEASLHRGA